MRSRQNGFYFHKETNIEFRKQEKMEKSVRSKVVKCKPSKEKKSRTDEANQDIVPGRHDEPDPSKVQKTKSCKTAFVDKGSNMATKTNSKTISTMSSLRTRKLINYRNLNNMGIVEATNNNATMAKTSNKIKSDQSRSSKKLMPNNSFKKKAICMEKNRVDKCDIALQKADPVNPISSLPTGDGVIVTGHAPMGEFEDDEGNESEDSSMSSVDEGDEPGGDPERVEPVEDLPNDNPELETEEEIPARYGNNPHFKNLMQHLLKSSIQGVGQSSQMQLPSTSDVRNVECHDETGVDVPFQQSQPVRK